MTTLSNGRADSAPVVDCDGASAPREGPVGKQRTLFAWSLRAAEYVVGFAGLVAVLYAVSVYTGAADSDKATTILVGQSLSTGNILLRGWILSPANYWTSDATIYALAVRLFGMGPWLLYAEPAVVGALTIVVGAVIATDRRRGAAAVAGALTVAASLVFAVHPMAIWFVGKSFHIATVLCALVAFWLLRSDRFGWRWILAVAILAFCLLGDSLIEAYAMAPLFAGGLIAMARRRKVRAGLPQLTAALASAVLGEAVLRLAHAIGAFKLGSPLPIARFSQMLVNLRHVFTYGADLVGLTNGRRFGTAGVPVALLEVHAVGAVAMVLCLLFALWRLVAGAVRGPSYKALHAEAGEPWRLDDLLAFATLVGILPFIALAGPNGVAVHLLALPVLFATVLTGRVVARGWSRFRPAQGRFAAVLGAVVLLGYAAGLAYQFAEPEPVLPASSLAGWLQEHRLTSGVGGYWVAALTTVYSHDTVRIAPVTAGPHGIGRLGFQSEASWYSGKSFQFYVFADSNTRDLTVATRSWGNAVHDYVVGPYRVLTWDHPLHVSAAVSAPARQR